MSGTEIATNIDRLNLQGILMLLQTHRLALQPQTTAHLAQTMTLLELPNAELRERIELELARNPALELLEEARCPQCRKPLPRTGPCPVCMSPRGNSGDEPIIFVSPRSDFTHPQSNFSGDELPSEELAAATEDLPTYVMRQIAPELAVEDRPLAAHLLTCLNEDGLLSISLSEVARYHHVSLGRVEAVQKVIQHADPIGVGSSSPQEALLAQIEVLSETRPIPPLANQAVLSGMDLLSRRAYNELAHLLQISKNEALKIASFISENLNPFPARAHWGDIHQSPDAPQIYQDPDIVISRLHPEKPPDDDQSTQLVVEIVSPYAGSLQVNPLFRKAINQAPPDKVDQWQSDMGIAVLLVKCLQQRNHTLVRLMRRLVDLQRHFILEGDAHLIPVTRAQLARELRVHESTISRSVAGKAVQLPNMKIIPLSKWFDRSLNVRTAILRIIAEEKKPLSDKQIVESLQKQGFSVARRTVAKYRRIEGILPARFRGFV